MKLSLVVTLQNYFKCLLYTAIGLFVALTILIYSVLSLPLILYRLIVTKSVSPCFSNIGKAVTVSGQFMAAEFLPSKGNHPDKPKRSVIMCCATIQGNISFEEMSIAVTSSWLNASNSESALKYPEFQQYIGSWMGFMFWKKDDSFSLANHIFVHEANSAIDTDSDRYIESIFNRQFVKNRSPWEIHLLKNMSPNSTTCVFRFHHAMVDGFSIMYAIVEGLCKRDLESVQLATPKIPVPNLTLPNTIAQVLLDKLIISPCRLFHDAGYLAALGYRSSLKQLSWYCPNHVKKWNQLYGKSSLIPITKIKFIKNQIGGTFTGVILSCIAAAASKTVSCGDFQSLPVYTVVPAGMHPNKLRNNVMGTILELDLVRNQEPLSRLKKTDRKFNDARYSSHIPFIMSTMGSLFSFPLAKMARFLCKNNMFPALVTNFPGPGTPLKFQGKECLSMDFGVGGEDGICGVTFSIVSYLKYVRITVIAEEGVMTRPELSELICEIEHEIERLYESVRGCQEGPDGTVQILIE